MRNQQIQNKSTKANKPSELDKFKLFYEYAATNTASATLKTHQRRTIHRSTL